MRTDEQLGSHGTSEMGEGESVEGCNCFFHFINVNVLMGFLVSIFFFFLRRARKGDAKAGNGVGIGCKSLYKKGVLLKCFHTCGSAFIISI